MSFLNKIKLFLVLSFRRKLLLLLVILLAIYSYILFRFFKSKAKFGNRTEVNIQHSNIDMSWAKDIRFAISVISKYIWWENLCRHQAYQAMLLCKFFKIPFQIYVGFKKSHEGKIEGHAWTMINGEMITGFCRVDEYIIQNVFS